MSVEQSLDQQFQKLKESLLATCSSKNSQVKQRYSFQKHLQQKLSSQLGFDSNKQIDILQANQYLKLLSHQKKYLSSRRALKVTQLNESLQLDQQEFKSLFLVSTQANYYKLDYPGYYARLLEQIPLYPKYMFSAIQKDIPRTLMDGHPFQDSLRNVLVAYAIRNPRLLYCQGMNYLVAYFLINNVEEEDTFWVLARLAENVLPDDYFKDLSTISITTQIFSDVLPYVFPEMAKQMKQIGMDCSLFIVSWYVCLFTKGFINSVSQYLLVKLTLQSRKHSFSFVLLKLSLGVIAAILGRDEPFTFRRQFSALKDKLQVSVFQISLLEIKLGIQYVQLNQQNFLKLQMHYRSKRQTRHLSAVEKDMHNKKFTLPKCSSYYPICLHRIEIQKKIENVQEVLIAKNGYNIMEQYIEDYFDFEPKKENNYQVYESINDCLMFREKHICSDDTGQKEEVNLEKMLFNRIHLRNDESFQQMSIKKIMHQNSSFAQGKSRFSKIDSKFIELSGFFVIDEKFNYGQQQVLQYQYDETLDNNQHISSRQSKKSFDQPFNLENQLKLNNIEQDWIKNEDDYLNIQQIYQNQNKKFVQKQNQERRQEYHQVDQKLQELNKKLTNQEDHRTNLNDKQNNQARQENMSKKTIQLSKQQVFSTREKIMTYFGNTWRRVLKIKQEQLKH